jgi:hypothetical protein
MDDEVKPFVPEKKQGKEPLKTFKGRNSVHEEINE